MSAAMERGIAHLLEHNGMFKGTKSLGTQTTMLTEAPLLEKIEVVAQKLTGRNTGKRSQG